MSYRGRAMRRTLVIFVLVGPLVGGIAFSLCYITMAGVGEVTAQGPIDLVIAMLFFYAFGAQMAAVFIPVAYLAGAVTAVCTGLVCALRVLCSRQPAPPSGVFALLAAGVGLLPMVYANDLYSLEAWSDWFVQFKVAAAMTSAVVCARILQRHWPRPEPAPDF